MLIRRLRLLLVVIVVVVMGSICACWNRGVVLEVNDTNKEVACGSHECMSARARSHKKRADMLEFHRNRGTCQEYSLRVSHTLLLSLIPEGFLLKQLLRAQKKTSSASLTRQRCLLRIELHPAGGQVL